MPEPVGPRSSEPPTLDLEPVLVTGRLRQPPQAELDVGAAVLGCVEKVSASAVALLAATPAMPLAGILGGAQAGFDLGLCLGKADADARQRASTQRALADCAAEGGTALGIVEHEVSCAVRAP